tara:strand:- start:1128 stop:1376 length:249 start_codon:yes stop_codon:yes gene_type:complete
MTTLDPMVLLIEAVTTQAERIAAKVDAIPCPPHGSLAKRVRAAQACIEDLKAQILLAGDPRWNGELEDEADARADRFEEGTR